MYQVVNPATGEIESEFPTAGAQDIEAALAKTHAAYVDWRRAPREQRATILRRVAAAHRDQIDRLASIVTREVGKPTREAIDELDFTASIYEYYASQGPTLLADRPLPSTQPGAAWVRISAIGPVLGVMPWNYPYYQVARFAAPNLMIGNTVILKHAPQCPESAVAMEEIFREAGLPDGAYVNVFATNEQVADMIADPRVAGVSVTGSERAGAAVAAKAGQHLKKVVLELGGSDPFIVLGADDLSAVVQQAVAARMENAGQACNAAKRMIVMDSLFDEFVSQFTTAMSAQVPGDPADPRTTFGPLSSQQAAQHFIAQISDAVEKGATLHLGGARIEGPGAFVQATVLSGVTPEMRAYREELFGPAAVIYKVHSVDEAVELANDTPYGLGASIFAVDDQVALDVADRLDTGMVWINEMEGGGPELPFGGTKRSGVGRELGPLGLEEFVNKKLIHVPPKD